MIDSEFNRIAEAFAPWHTQLVALPYHLSQAWLHSDAFQKEVAIASFDWLFTPIPKSPERLVLSTGNSPPSSFRRTSTCSGIDQLASTRTPVISGAIHTQPHVETTGFSLSLWLPLFKS